jgi:hypothetical protein
MIVKVRENILEDEVGIGGGGGSRCVGWCGGVAWGAGELSSKASGFYAEAKRVLLTCASDALAVGGAAITIASTSWLGWVSCGRLHEALRERDRV